MLLQDGKYPNHLKDTAISTAKFIEKMTKLFDILNGRVFLKHESKETEFLQEMQKYILQVQCCTQPTRAHCFKGLGLTIESVLQLTKDLCAQYVNIQHLNLKKLNHDPVENFFSRIRCRNANKKSSSLFEFEALFAKVQSIKLIFSLKFASYNIE